VVFVFLYVDSGTIYGSSLSYDSSDVTVRKPRPNGKSLSLYPLVRTTTEELCLDTSPVITNPSFLFLLMLVNLFNIYIR